MDDNVLKKEKKHLEETLSKIEYAKDVVIQNIESIGKENLEKLKDLRDDPETSGTDFHFFLEQLHQKNLTFNIKDKYKKLDELSYLSKEPYFARIDLQDSSQLQKIYVGKFGYTEDIPIVTDWRAKIASVYYRYRYPQKNVKYETPLGVETRDLLLKRTYEIDDGSLVKYYNNDIQLDESEIIAEKIEKRTGGVLEDIVETIQEAQLDIIEADPRQICIVQGCVGSGKSTVAIHKLSHIFFNFPSVVKPERSILIAKNQILVGYLSTLFPKLGIFDINYKTLRELIFHLIFREEININVDLDQNTDTSGFTKAYLKKLRNSIGKIHQKVAVDIDKLLTDEEFAGFAGFKYISEETVFENLNELTLDLEEELNMQRESVKENPKSIRAELHKENIKVLKKLIGKIKKLRLDLKTYTFPKLLKTYGINSTDKLGYKDTLILLYIYLELFGLKNFKQYEYCVVDEGQDFSVLEYSVLGKLVLHGRFSILGDLNQSYKEEGITQWEDISDAITEAKSAQTFLLETNYRSTKPIIDLANKILSPHTKTYLPKSINRIGTEPEILEFDKSEDLFESLKNSLNHDIKHLSKSIGIICFDSVNFEASKEIVFKSDIDKSKFIELDPRVRISYIPKGIYLTMFNDCKGLEFAKVYILGLNLDKTSTFKKAKEAFVAVTRAMNEVSIYSVK